MHPGDLHPLRHQHPPAAGAGPPGGKRGDRPDHPRHGGRHAGGAVDRGAHGGRAHAGGPADLGDAGRREEERNAGKVI